MQITDDMLPLPAVPRALAPYPGGPTVTYGRLYAAVTNGVLPAERIGARWFLKRSDLPAVAAQIGLAPPHMPIAA